MWGSNVYEVNLIQRQYIFFCFGLGYLKNNDIRFEGRLSLLQIGIVQYQNDYMTKQHDSI